MGMLLKYYLIFLLLSASPAISEIIHKDQFHIAKNGCSSSCGDIEIPYPFGIEDGCYFNEAGAGHNYKINCIEDAVSGVSTPFHYGNLANGDVPLLGISLKDNTLRISSQVAYQCYNGSTNTTDMIRRDLTMPEFTPSPTRNKFVAMGCDTQANVAGERRNESGDSVHYATGCTAFCTSITDVKNGDCSGAGCCATAIPEGITTTEVSAWTYFNHIGVTWNPCSVAANFSVDNLTVDDKGLLDLKLPMVVDWWIVGGSCKGLCGEKNVNCTQGNKGYRCVCEQGWKGNPYLQEGCHVVDCGRCNMPTPEQITIVACILLIILLLGVLWWLKHCEKNKLLELKEKFFQQNGGFMLSQMLDRRDISTQKFKIFASHELEKATNNYAESSIVGKGGFGIVYKGILANGEVVAVKKSLKVDQTQVEQFVNEVLVLSEVNNKNIVKLLGCCLEAEAPLLVYEFVKNGTLYEHLHDPRRATLLSWDIRLSIAESVACVLSYLHTTISIPIVHRDIKSMNILLDDDYTAKVSDFGASRLGVMDHCKLATMVLGTWGYLDPEYMQTSELTEKSDVYSFGVVLAELLTGKKAVSHDCPEGERSLAMHFLSKIKEDRLFDIVDAEIRKTESLDKIKGVANLAKQCLAVKGDERPSMKQVARELEVIRIVEKHSWSEDDANIDECQSLFIETLLHSESSSGSQCDDNQTRSLLALNSGR